jgi:hypothetical protein
MAPVKSFREWNLLTSSRALSRAKLLTLLKIRYNDEHSCVQCQ